MICIHYIELFFFLQIGMDLLHLWQQPLSVLPLFPVPRVEGAAVAGIRELSLCQLSQALQWWEGLQSKSRAGFQRPHLPQPFRGEGTQSCGRNIPESHAENMDTGVEVMN